MTPASWILAGGAFAVGSCLGSYAVTAAIRYARDESSLWGRSHCDGCQVSLGFAETIPLVSFARLRGRCSRCRAPIDPVHLAGEAVGGLALASLVLVGVSVETALIAVLVFLLLATGVVDLKIRQLPDGLSAVIAAIGLVLAWRAGPDRLWLGLAAAAAAAAVLLLVRSARRRSGRDPGLGLGDVKLIAALALWLGVATPWMIVAASALGLIVMLVARPPDGRLPFGPMIGMAAVAVGLCAQQGWAPWLI